MGGLTGPEIIDRFEQVLVDNLGDVGRYLLQQQLLEVGKTRETFTENDVNALIQAMKDDFTKVIGYGVDKLELDLRKAIKEDDYV
jgi:hypothetical protein